MPWLIQGMHREAFAVSLTILYHHAERPNERGMTMIAGQPESAAVIAQLEKRGFVVDKITFAEPRLPLQARLR
jgi:hypothetical protein